MSRILSSLNYTRTINKYDTLDDIMSHIGRLRFNHMIKTVDQNEIKWCDDPSIMGCPVDSVELVGYTHLANVIIILKDVMNVDETKRFIKWINNIKEFRPVRLFIYHPSMIQQELEGLNCPFVGYNEAMIIQFLSHPLIKQRQNRKLTMEEYEEYMKMYKLNSSNVQKIDSTDPVCIFLNLVSGDVLMSELKGTNDISIRLVQ